MDVTDLISKLTSGRYEFSQHAFVRAIERNISGQEVTEAGRCVEIVESYPDDKYSPSCLLLGFTKSGRPLHMQVCYTEEDMLKIITIYEPDVFLWLDYRMRRMP